MVDLEKAVVARLETHGERFEVLVDPNSVEDIKAGKVEDIVEHLVIDTIFKDSSKGDKASEEKMKEIFETDDVAEVALKIINDGHIQLTTEQRREMAEKKRLQIVTTIARNAVNPQTGAPHPPQRIELAMEEAHVHVDPFKPVDHQVQDVLEALRPLLPIRFEKVKVAVHLAGDEYGKCYGDMSGMGAIQKDEWQKDGSWIGVVEIPAGLQLEFIDILNKRTKGNVDVKVLREE